MNAVAPLPAPLVPADCDLQDFAFMPLQVARLRGSDMAALVDPAACWFAVMLWCAAWHQVPAGSLPDDDAVMAHLAGLGRDVRTFKRMKPGALRGFVLCADGRLYHPVVAEEATRAWVQKLQQRHRTECARRRQEASRRKVPYVPIPFERWFADSDYLPFAGVAAPCADEAVSLAGAGDGAGGEDGFEGALSGVGHSDMASLGGAVSHGQGGHVTVTGGGKSCDVTGFEAPRDRDRENIKKGRKIPPTNQPLDSGAGAQPATGEDGWLDGVLDQVAVAAGLRVKAGSAKRDRERAVVAGWLDGWPGGRDAVDVGRDLVGPVRAFLVAHPGVTSSLARFDAVVLDRKARASAAAPSVASPSRVSRAGEGDREGKMRWRIDTADGGYPWLIGRCRLEIHEAGVTIVCPDVAVADAVTNRERHGGPVDLAAKSVLGLEFGKVDVVVEQGDASCCG